MSPFLADPDVTLYHGDALAVLREFPSASVNCAVTSPPYWGLRDYGADGQLGLEATPEAYVEALVAVMAEVRRVLADDGTLWLNLGDSYATNGGRGESRMAELGRPSEGALTPSAARGSAPGTKFGGGLKEKDLVGIPWRVAFALQADGWYLRSDIIWAKPNPMPESVTDRPTKAHEYVFLLSKSPRYWFDQEAVREKYDEGYKGRLDTGPASNGTVGHAGWKRSSGPDGRKVTSVVGANGSIQHRDGERWPNGGRNVRSVWEIATQPYSGAHFATFPEELVRRCILAGCPEWVCGTCGKPRERLIERQPDGQHPGGVNRHHINDVSRGTLSDVARYESTTLGWSDCGHGNYRPGVVLDPFGGSGTTALVARKHGRRAVLIELNETYCQLAARRLQQLSLLAEGTA